eukprot:TRINITY_DN15306_c0_g1::TRINITY_DN15306_c0_g1_i1::g.30875::m.30875 TRINITY_DN15306_c0_g1::TRINITY_DN15306_c0_g1_i1::g.30875  ORF type:complete len:197 (+),score=-0.77,BBS2_Mid/PF14783.1/0.3 TRINITY_DN15306_c0_g1_i1:832-1422(+)
MSAATPLPAVHNIANHLSNRGLLSSFLLERDCAIDALTFHPTLPTFFAYQLSNGTAGLYDLVSREIVREHLPRDNLDLRRPASALGAEPHDACGDLARSYWFVRRRPMIYSTPLLDETHIWTTSPRLSSATLLDMSPPACLEEEEALTTSILKRVDLPAPPTALAAHPESPFVVVGLANNSIEVIGLRPVETDTRI